MQVEVQLVELRRVDGRRCIEHHVAAGIVLRESDVVADRLRAAEQRAQTVEPEGQAAVRRRAVLEGVHQETELLLRLLGREAQAREDRGLQLGIVDTDRTAADLGTVADEVVGVGAHAARVAFEVGHVLGFGRGEGVMHRVEALRLVVPLEHREIHDPQRSEPLGPRKASVQG